MLDRDLYRGLNNEVRERDPGPRQSDAHASLSEELPLHPEHPAVEPSSAGVAREHLHPVESPPPWRYAETREERLRATEDFVYRLTSIVEQEYGDWMRRANNYWWDLAYALQGSGAKVDELMAELQMIIQYQPNFRMAETSRQAIAVLSKIRQALGVREPLDWHQFNLGVTSVTETEPVPPYSLRIDHPIKPDIEDYVSDGNDLSINGELRGFRL